MRAEEFLIGGREKEESLLGGGFVLERLNWLETGALAGRRMEGMTENGPIHGDS